MHVQLLRHNSSAGSTNMRAAPCACCTWFAIMGLDKGWKSLTHCNNRLKAVTMQLMLSRYVASAGGGLYCGSKHALVSTAQCTASFVEPQLLQCRRTLPQTRLL
jgi:hypothetical protein